MMKSFQKKSVRFLCYVLLVYVTLVAAHKGEFWPFSIYPMFSQAGNPWTRALVRDVSSTPDSLKWQISTYPNLQGSPVAVKSYGVEQIDFAGFVSKTKDWDPERRQALKRMFGAEGFGTEELMVMKVKGQLVEKDSVAVRAFPVVLITADSVYLRPHSLTNK